MPLIDLVNKKVKSKKERKLANSNSAISGQKKVIKVNMAKTRHKIHKYHHVNTPNGKLWFCALPDCNHHMPKHYEAGMMGKGSYCWECGNEMILDEIALKMDKPNCPTCRLGLSANHVALNESINDSQESQVNEPLEGNLPFNNESNELSIEDMLKRAGILK